ncbi:MAG: redox-sensitive bicupin YhaK (pirin superfamily) [Paracoccaceae bacterium]|jgi:redox-sensitive bicupin YhaK (pirin superfamily)
MIRISPFGKLRGIDAPGLRIRDHFRGSPENVDTPVFGLGPMRVLADTQIAPQTGFPMHGHRDFEIVTYVCEGMIAHEDTTGAKGTLRMGDVQAMTTGSGVMHSESNPGDDPTRVYQMWFHAEKAGLTPDYTDLVAPPPADPGDFTVYASGAAHIDGLISIRQDAAVMGASLQRGESILRELAPGRLAYVLAVDGPLAVNDSGIPQRGGAEIRDETTIRIAASETPSRVLLIDVAETYAGPTA